MEAKFVIIIALKIIFLLPYSCSAINFYNIDTALKSSDTSKPILYLFVDRIPTYVGGERKLQEFITNNMKWPSNEFGGPGTVLTSFIVERDGRISDIRIERELCPPCDKEARRLLNLMPNWKAGKVKGILVRVRVYLPIFFELKE